MAQDQHITIAELIQALQQFPLQSTVEAYEGEETGLTITMPDGRYGFIRTDKQSDGSLHIEQEAP